MHGYRRRGRRREHAARQRRALKRSSHFRPVANQSNRHSQGAEDQGAADERGRSSAALRLASARMPPSQTVIADRRRSYPRRQVSARLTDPASSSAVEASRLVAGTMNSTSASCSQRMTHRSPSSNLGGDGNRKRELTSGTATRAVNGDGPPVRFDQRLHQCKTKSKPSRYAFTKMLLIRFE